MIENLLDKSKNILICPLNWGLGHACRIIPIIEYCIDNNKNIILAGNGSSLKLLKHRFPTLKNEYISAPILSYSKNQSIGFRFYFSFFRLFVNIFRERRYLNVLIKKHNIDTIISDNRPGISSPRVKSIYITHQINVFYSDKSDIFSRVLTKLHLRIIKKYTYCFVPDYADNSIAGKLSKNTTGLNLIYLGPLSRFLTSGSVIDSIKPQYKIVCIVSGLEPQRTVFEELLLKKFKNEQNKVLILRGLPKNKNTILHVGNIDLIDHCDDSFFVSSLLTCELIICRSGYSTIMDLMTIGRKAILVPTPGQPEQEYLGNYLKNKGFVCLKQNEIINFDVTSIDLSTCSANEKYEINLKNVLDLYL